MKDFFKFLFSKAFLKQLLYVVIFLIAIVLLVLFWLRIYTNHGQKIEMPDFVNTSLKEAREEAKSKTFEIIVTDSIHKVGRPGGIILDQNPHAGSQVKENRKVYVNITKFSPDKIKVADLPVLYGNDYNQKKTELKYRDINTAIRGSRYDKGEPNHILEVWYKDELIISDQVVKSSVEIDKGGLLEFIVSERVGGKDIVPDLRCRQLSEAETMLLLAKFQLGEVETIGEIKDQNTAYVVRQMPPFDNLTTFEHNTPISVIIAQDKPEDCQ